MICELDRGLKFNAVLHKMCVHAIYNFMIYTKARTVGYFVLHTHSGEDV